MKTVKLSEIKGADYNPRKLTDEAFEKLKQSLTDLGVCVPVLVNSANNTIIAGHQRTKSMRALGIEETPAIFIKNLNIGDEIKFNQVHNSIESKDLEPTVLTKETDKIGFTEFEVKDFELGTFKIARVNEICRLLVKYGNCFSAVIAGNEVVFSHNYVKACALLNMRVKAYVLPAEYLELAKYYFSQDYGEYSYDNIERHTYVQGLAQMNRNTVKTDKKQNASQTYERLVLPFLNKFGTELSILDFGAGKQAYINMLKHKYDKAVGVEFYNNNGKGINTKLGHQLIDDLIAYLKTGNLFDIVVIDSVLNSVDSLKAEQSVVDIANTFLKMGGSFFVSGRNTKAIKYANENVKKKQTLKRNKDYLDEDGFRADFREGKWYFRKFHTKRQVINLLSDSGFEIVKSQDLDTNNDAWRVHAIKRQEISLERKIEAIDFEFNLPLPHGKNYNRHEDVKRAMGLDKK